MGKGSLGKKISYKGFIRIWKVCWKKVSEEMMSKIEGSSMINQLEDVFYKGI